MRYQERKDSIVPPKLIASENQEPEDEFALYAALLYEFPEFAFEFAAVAKFRIFEFIAEFKLFNSVMVFILFLSSSEYKLFCVANILSLKSATA